MPLDALLEADGKALPGTQFPQLCPALAHWARDRLRLGPPMGDV